MQEKQRWEEKRRKKEEKVACLVDTDVLYSTHMNRTSRKKARDWSGRKILLGERNREDLAVGVVRVSGRLDV